ncbi:MAG: LptE family protein [Acidobacteriia bacterium]|nr:LptE family protein [Terriglobia bacterium]
MNNSEASRIKIVGASGRLIAGAAFFLLLLLAPAGCGYHVAGKANALPPSIRTIAVPTFTNVTIYFKAEQKLTRALLTELISRTKYRVVSSPEGADAVISGRVNNIVATPVIFDSSGRATTFLITIAISVSMTDPSKKTVYYENKNFNFRDQYEISGDPSQFFQEDTAALDRLSRQFAQTLVSAILENF